MEERLADFQLKGRRIRASTLMTRTGIRSSAT
jgi:hypothetical protein